LKGPWRLTYSHEENYACFYLVDDVPEEVKQTKASEIMELQSQISWSLNQEERGKTLRCIRRPLRKENIFVGRSEFEFPDGDNEVLR